MSNSGILFRKYIWLTETINNQRLTRQEISDRWEHSPLNEKGGPLAKKTFYNHLDAIEEIFHLKIRCHKYGDNTYYIENAEEVEEKSNLADWLISTISVSNAVHESCNLSDRIIYEDIPSGQNFLMTILEAMKENKSLIMTYEGFWDNVRSTFTVQPYLVKVFRRRWYLVGKNVEKDAIRTYALDRIIDIDILDGCPFELPEDFNPKTYFADYFGVIHDESYDTEDVRIRVTNGQQKYIESLPLHKSQRIVERGDDYVTFGYRLKPTFDFVQEIFSHAADFEVLEPAWLRKEIADGVTQMKNLYENERK